ncbi:MAG: hypothetical protein ACYTAN_04935, partial [Planctomycetota bacterium]
MSALTDKVGEGELAYAVDFGDIAPGRIGNGSIVWDVPLSDPALAECTLEYRDLARGAGDEGPALLSASGETPGILVLELRSPYVYLGGRI